MSVSNLLVVNAHVLDIRTGEFAAADMWCREGVIEQIGPGLQPDVPGAAVLDARGAFVVPGLVDAHVHLTSVDFDLGVNERVAPSWVTAQASVTMREMLSRGFTTVRDVGGADHGLALAQERGIFPGPRILQGGPALSQTGGHADFREAGDDSTPVCGHGVGRVVDGVDEVRRAARDAIRKGADHLKIMASGGVASPTDRIDSTQFSVEEIRTVVAEAEAANRYVAAHAYTARAINRCLENGVRSIEHGNLLDDHSLELLIAHDAFLVPNVGVYRILDREGREHGQSAESAAKLDAILNAGLASLEKAHARGVNIAFGSDLLGPMHKYQNEEFLVRSEVQPALAILRSATITGARLLGREGQTGELSAGADADMVLLDADPLEDIGVLAEPAKYVQAVVQQGRVMVRHGRLHA
jgi:imidazolonepropionase-like amidohydrolase